MIEPQSHQQLKNEITARIGEDRKLLDQLRGEIAPLRSEVRRIQPRSATAISLVGTDGGNNKIKFDPFLVQLIRVVDSSNNEYCLEAITPTTDIWELSSRQFRGGTPLGQLMSFLGIRRLDELSPMIRKSNPDQPVSPSWVQVYRELTEWAVLFSIVQNKNFGTDTLIIFDGLLRSKVFAGNLFAELRKGLQQSIEEQYKKNRRNIYLAGIAKHSQVLSRYRLAMALENILTTDFPAYLEIPRTIEEKAYVWAEYARGDDNQLESGEINKFVGGKMFFVKFGPSPRDPIWPVDIYSPQVPHAQIIIGNMLADAVNGFPVPFYPLCLQRAHENAALVDFDMDILQDLIFESIRNVLGQDAPILDAFRFQDTDPSQGRYE